MSLEREIPQVPWEACSSSVLPSHRLTPLECCGFAPMAMPGHLSEEVPVPGCVCHSPSMQGTPGPGSGSWEMAGSWKSSTHGLTVHCTSPHHNHLPLQFKDLPLLLNFSSWLHSTWNMIFLGFFTVSHFLPWIFTFNWRTCFISAVWWTLVLWKPLVLYLEVFFSCQKDFFHPVK